MHSIEGKSCWFRFNGDFSGKIQIATPSTEGEVEVDFDDLKMLVAERIRRDSIARLEDASSDDILSPRESTADRQARLTASVSDAPLFDWRSLHVLRRGTKSSDSAAGRRLDIVEFPLVVEYVAKRMLVLMQARECSDWSSELQAELDALERKICHEFRRIFGKEL